MVKDIPITIYSEAWKSPLEVLLGEFPSTGQGNPTWTIHLCLGRANNAASDAKAHGSPPVKADPDEPPIKPDPEPPINPDPEPSSSRKRQRSYSDLLQELEEQRARTDQVVREYVSENNLERSTYSVLRRCSKELNRYIVQKREGRVKIEISRK